MPNRIIRESCRTSPSLSALSDAAERLFWRLTTFVDDYGRFEANADIIKGACLPLVKWQTAKVKTCLEELGRKVEGDETPLVIYYTVKGRLYGQLSGWSKHQRPARLASKFPDPPDVLTIPAEKNIHDRLFEDLREKKHFCGHTVLAVDRNVRAGNGFADLLLEIEGGRILIELKRTRADVGAIKQVCSYRDTLKGITSVVIIAAGMGPTVGVGDFAKEGVALITYNEKGETFLQVPNTLISQCSNLVIPVNSREIEQFPDTRDESRDPRDGSRESRDEKRAPAAAGETLEKFQFAEVEEWTELQGVDMHAARLEFDDFKDYWRGCGGKNKKGPVRDWPATWRRRIRELKKDGRIKLAAKPRPTLVVEKQPQRSDPPTPIAKKILENLLPNVAASMGEASA